METKNKDKNKPKKMTNEGHSAKVPHGGAIGLVFLGGLIVGCIVVFLAVAGRTQSVIAERKVLLKEKKNRAAAGEVVPAEAAALPQEAPAAEPAPVAPSTETEAAPSSSPVVP